MCMCVVKTIHVTSEKVGKNRSSVERGKQKKRHSCGSCMETLLTTPFRTKSGKSSFAPAAAAPLQGCYYVLSLTYSVALSVAVWLEAYLGGFIFSVYNVYRVGPKQRRRKRFQQECFNSKAAASSDLAGFGLKWVIR